LPAIALGADSSSEHETPAVKPRASSAKVVQTILRN
jgi:hypothetical protein